MLSVKRVLKLLWLAVIIFVFCPVFLVSCSGPTYAFSMMDMTIGMASASGEPLMAGEPALLIFFMIPVVAYLLLVLKTLPHKLAGGFVSFFAVLDLVLWVSLRHMLESALREQAYALAPTFWYNVNLIVLAAIFVVALPVAFGHRSLNTVLFGRAPEEDEEAEEDEPEDPEEYEELSAVYPKEPY